MDVTAECFKESKLKEFWCCQGPVTRRYGGIGVVMCFD
jgi:hypothetical protein